MLKVAGVVVLGAIMSILDITVVSVALETFQREFDATYGNRLDAVTREQKALKDGSVPRTEIEAQLAALKAENQAMRVDGQAAIDAISAENADLKSRLATQAAAPAPAPAPAAAPARSAQRCLAVCDGTYIHSSPS